jgi:hypothetical protein
VDVGVGVGASVAVDVTVGFGVAEVVGAGVGEVVGAVVGEVVGSGVGEVVGSGVGEVVGSCVSAGADIAVPFGTWTGIVVPPKARLTQPSLVRLLYTASWYERAPPVYGGGPPVSYDATVSAKFCALAVPIMNPEL